MRFVVYIVSAIFIIHAADSYILLTANLDDVHSIVKELAQSPVSEQIETILRRAYNQFQKMDFQQLLKRDRDHGYYDQGRGSGEGPHQRKSQYVAGIGEPHRRHFEAPVDAAKALDETKAPVDIENKDDEKEAEIEAGKENYYIKSINKVLDTVN